MSRKRLKARLVSSSQRNVASGMNATRQAFAAGRIARPDACGQTILGVVRQAHSFVVTVERHHGTAIHSRAGHFQLRTIELLRSVGIENAVRLASENQFPPDGGISAVESLAGNEIATYIGNLNEGVAKYSPTVRLFMTQQSLEPILRARAAELGALTTTVTSSFAG